MWESTYIATTTFLREICNLDGIAIYFEIVEPLEITLAQRYENSAFDRLAKLCEGLGARKQVLMQSVSARQGKPN